ncbi:MAG: hypothetical protein EOO56_16735 [Hymenobacter sp.]|nr:MAG: hypothetical protein EOO56_16735 [Hymenobacter sp.]
MDSWLNEKQQALSDFMSEISEEAWCADWMEDLEYVLWYAILYGPAHYGRKFISEQTISQLVHLSEGADCWIVFDDDTWKTAVALPIWQERFQAVDPHRYLKYYQQ